MIELPETINLTAQINNTLVGKTITDVYVPEKINKFTFFSTDNPEDYKPLLTGKTILSARGSGMFVDIQLSDDVALSVGDGTIMRYGDSSSQIPPKYQLLLVFDDETFLAFTVTMYGMIYAHQGELDNKYYRMSFEKTSPLSDAFDKDFFLSLLASEQKNISVKAFLATGQRIPGLGNGVLQDILFNARIHPKKKINSLTDAEKIQIFDAVKSTLKEMTELNGRDSQPDIFGEKGKYKTILSASTYKKGCPVCKGEIRKEAYMGGSVYYCPACQVL